MWASIWRPAEREDVTSLLPAGVRFNDDDALDAFERVWFRLVALGSRVAS